MKHDMKFITTYRDGRKKKFRVRVGDLDMAFYSAHTARFVRDIELAGAYRLG